MVFCGMSNNHIEVRLLLMLREFKRLVLFSGVTIPKDDRDCSGKHGNTSKGVTSGSIFF
jgi:hypothetical protein